MESLPQGKSFCCKFSSAAALGSPVIIQCVTKCYFVQGPAMTPYEGGVFELDIKVPDQYPLVPPTVFYRTKIFHPNVHFKVWQAL